MAASTIALFRKTGDAAYDALRMKYDWNAPKPPPGYRFGVGRGARAFVTSAEVNIASKPSAASADLEFLQETDRVEEAMRNHSRRKRLREDAQPPAVPAAQSAVAKPKLSADDLMTIGNGLVEGKGSSAAHPPVAGGSGGGDVPMDGVQQQLFETDIEIRLPLADFTQRAVDASATVTADMLTKGEIDAILKFGSEDDQKTWITRSRVQKQLGHRKHALRELEAGCKHTGSKGSAIWLELLSFWEGKPEQQRLVAEAAVVSFPSSEVLWTRAVDLNPYHRQLELLQRALVAVPSSESLWLRLLREVPDPRERKAIIRKCLETNERERSSNPLSRLWGMLAELEPEEKGRTMLQLVVQRRQPPQLSALLELAWYEEKFAIASFRGTQPSREEPVAELLRGMLSWSLDRTPSSPVHALQNIVFCEAAAPLLHVGVQSSREEWTQLIHMSLEERHRPLTAVLLSLSMVLPKAVLMHLPLSIASDRLSASWLSDLVDILIAPQCPKWRDDGTLTAAHCNLLLVVWACQLVIWQHADCVRMCDRNFLRIVRAVIGTADLACLQAPPTSEDSAAVPTDDEEELLGSVTTPAPADQRLLRGGGVVWTFLYNTLSRLSTASADQGFVDVLLTAARALFERHQVDVATALIHMFDAEVDDDRVVVALARLEQQRQAGAAGDSAAEAILRQRCLASPRASPYVWKKWLVHLRSCNTLTVDISNTAVQRFPRDAPLRMIQLRHLVESSGHLLHNETSAASARVAIRASYLRALDDDACRDEPTVWGFIAAFIEAEHLVDPGAARRIVSDAMERFGPRRSIRNGIVTYSEMDEAMNKRLVPVVLASVAIELRYADANAAMAALKPTLDRMVLKPDELVALSIDLTPRATRGTAAGVVMRASAAQGPLTLLAVAHIYHSIKQPAKCIRLVASALRDCPRCGDAYALLLALVRRAPADYVEIVAADVLEPLHPGVGARIAACVGQGDGLEAASNDVVQALLRDAVAHRPNHGPLWIAEAKQRDPANNVRLSGYRRGIDEMLLSIADRMVL